MRVNRLAEIVRWQGRSHRLLKERAGRARSGGRPPVVLVPSCFGVALDDTDGRPIWGRRHQLLFGRSFTDGRAAGRAHLLAQLDLVPGLYGYDVLGGYVRYLEDVGGYRRDDDLFVFAYDWRRPVTECARALAEFLRGLAGAADLTVDLVGLSSGGTVIRRWLADAAPAMGQPRVTVRRVVYVCSPQRGSLSALEYIQAGMEFWRFGRRFHEVGNVPGVWDALPHPDDPLFVDDRGTPIAASLFDPELWRRFRLVGHDAPDLEARLARGLAGHRALDRAAAEHPHPPSWVIGSNHVPTVARVVIDGDKLVIPHCLCSVDAKAYPFAFQPGDGTVPSATIAAAPNPAAPPWWTRLPGHQELGRSSGVRQLTVEALIAPTKPDVRGLYTLRVPRSRA